MYEANVRKIRYFSKSCPSTTYDYLEMNKIVTHTFIISTLLKQNGVYHCVIHYNENTLLQHTDTQTYVFFGVIVNNYLFWFELQRCNN